MDREILANVTPRETRVALIEQGVLGEIFIERTKSLSLVGNVYKGVVKRVLPGMQAAFVDIGLSRTGFLHADDTLTAIEYYNKDRETDLPPINEILRSGEVVIVQVVKEPMGSKGARLTMCLSILSRHLVFFPCRDCLGVSQKIIDESERERLRSMVEAVKKNSGGFIIRTSAKGISEDKIKRDILLLYKQWQEIETMCKSAKPEQLVYHGLGLKNWTVRDLLTSEVSRMLVDSRESFESCKDFADKYTPSLSHKIQYYDGDSPIFELYAVEDEIHKALSKTVLLKSGGHLVFDQTEAMITVDVNTGTFVGTKNLEETTFKTNLEATQAIARQIRLRNLGGIIILDFIDMKRDEHKDKVLRSLNKNISQDPAKTSVSKFSDLGLVEVTRKRSRESLEHILCETCPTCEGKGSIKTVETVSYEIFREIIRVSKLYETKELLVLTAPGVIDYILDEEYDYFTELEKFVNKRIKLQAEALYMQDQYDVVLV